MKLNFYHTLYIGASQAFLGSFVFLLIDFRKPVAKWRKRWIAAALLIVGSNLIALLFLNFWEMYYRVGFFTVTLPSILVTLWCFQYRDFRAVFSIITGLFVGCIGTATEMLATLLLQNTKYCEYYAFGVRVISFFLMFFILWRFSVAYSEILEEWDYLTKTLNVSIVVLDMPLLDTRQERDLTGRLISDIVLQLLSYVAETERRNIRQRQAEGIRAARKRGDPLGRKQIDMPPDFAALADAWQQGELSSRAAAERLGISHQTFLRRVKKFRAC